MIAMVEISESAFPPQCSACGGFEHLCCSVWHGPHYICAPCFMIWYDPPEDVDQTNPAQIGALSLKLKAAGKYPWPHPADPVR